MRSDCDASIFQNRLGVEAAIRKTSSFICCSNMNSSSMATSLTTVPTRSNPGGTNAFLDPAGSENPGFHTERYYIRYKFEGTPLKLHVGADLWNVDQAGIVGDDDPRIALFADFGNFDAMAAAVIQYESQRHRPGKRQ